MNQPFDLWGQRGWHNQEVVGESNYSTAIRRIVGNKVGTEWVEVATLAQLVPEPKNKYDRNAVQVLISGSLVGYLPREDAARYVGVLGGLASRGLIPQVCARVAGAVREDWETDRERFVGSVSLDLNEPHLLVPANNPPGEPHVVLPYGSAVQVTGEEAHIGRLAPVIGQHGQTWIHVTLHEVTEQLARSTRTVVEVRVNGLASGQLTPKMSGEYLPAVQHFTARGIATCARAILKGNQLKADIVLHAAKSGDLPQELLASVPAQRQADVAPVPVWRFNPPPGWPEPPPGWMPPPGWAPPAQLPPAPAGWQWWVAAETTNSVTRS